MMGDDAPEPAFVFTDMAGRICTIPQKSSGSFSGSVLPEWCRPQHSDLVFHPDAAASFGATAELAFGTITHARHGSPAWFDSRAMLGRVTGLLADQGIELRIGLEAEFYIFEKAEVETGLSHSRVRLESVDMVLRDAADPQPYRVGYPRMQFRPPPFDRHAKLRRRIVQQLAARGVGVTHHDHEAGPGQQEIALAPQPPVAACDALSVLKLTTHEMADHDGLTASFMPLPLSWCPGSGLHVHISAGRAGQDMLYTGGRRSDEGRRILRTLAAAIPSLSAFCTPSPSGLRRLWMMRQGLGGRPVAGYADRRALIRLIHAGGGDVGRIELRFPDASGDPYAMLTVILASLFLRAPEPMPVPDYAPVLAMRPLLDQAMDALGPVLEAAGAHPRFAPAYRAFRCRELDALAMSASVAEMQLHLGC
ncbi:hypothetical protein [uncultured Roseobacter sp.]|uniref:hypothetical protein n=1 Tax=uncultured Roseobacter sp. TaxID=114847 RepID=UPI00261B13AA|nr:hypothetical protein [uncultured Roseobacter sp.]